MAAQPAKFFQGIEASLLDRTSVIELYVEAREADDFFYWSATSEKPVEKLRTQFPNLKKIMIEDDYLIQSQIDALNRQLPPIEIEWKYRMYIDGCHGR